jgi:hypothetical protein
MREMLEIEEIANVPVFYINWQTLSIVREALVPNSSSDWLWYSRESDCFLNESELYFTEDAALTALNGYLNSL